MRENVLREMASRAVMDPNFLRQARQNLESPIPTFPILILLSRPSSARSIRQ